jgi:hypothetical protein
VVCAIAALAAAVAFGGWRFAVSPDSLAWHRVAIWRAVVDLTMDHGLAGVGPGGLVDSAGTVRIPHQGRVARHLHRIGSAESTVLGMAVRTGAVGSCLLLAGLWCAWRRWRRGGLFASLPGRAAVGSMVALAVVHDQLGVGIVLLWWGCVVGALEASCGNRAPESAQQPAAGPRWMVAVATAGALLWGLGQPAFARLVWWTEPSSPELAERAVRAEMWYTDPLSWRVREVLARPRWSFVDAAEAIHFSTRAITVDRGKAALWSDHGRVYARVVNDLGPWPDAVARARQGYRRGCELEPHLPWTWLWWAQLERHLGRLDSSERLARRAVSEEPNFVRGWLFLARLELDRGRPSVAREACERALAARSLRRKSGLADYERELLVAPDWQLQEVAAALD